MQKQERFGALQQTYDPLRSADRKLHPDVGTSLKSLSISDSNSHFRKAPEVAESWEDDEAASSSDSQSASPRKEPTIPGAPPPTPISPSLRGGTGTAWEEFSSSFSPPASRSHGSNAAQSPSSRPEKSTAAASRMIAGALGVRAPKKNEEERAYERAIREKETKRIAREKEERRVEEERRTKARAQIWED
ncbi:MAG: hypothetical protein Q9183_000086 [Haloplaca sp. 2 TL-2023]